MKLKILFDGKATQKKKNNEIISEYIIKQTDKVYSNKAITFMVLTHFYRDVLMRSLFCIIYWYLFVAGYHPNSLPAITKSQLDSAYAPWKPQGNNFVFYQRKKKLRFLQV